MFRSPFQVARDFNGGIAIIDAAYFPNDVWFVQSSHPNAGNTPGRGQTPDQPFSTLAYAITRAAAGDRIILLPTHTEALSAAGTVTINKAGVQIIGTGFGRARPVFTYSTAVGASFDITAANVAIQNVVFDGTGFDNITAMVNVGAAAHDATFIGCEFEFANATNQAALAILTAVGQNRLRIENCHFHGTNNAGTAAAIRIVSGNDHVIRNNVITGAFTTTLGGIDNASTAVVNIVIEGNRIVNQTAVSTVAINLQASSTGIAAFNILGILSGTAPIVGAALNVVGNNYYKAAAGVAAGTLI